MKNVRSLILLKKTVIFLLIQYFLFGSPKYIAYFGILSQFKQKSLGCKTILPCTFMGSRENVLK